MTGSIISIPVFCPLDNSTALVYRQAFDNNVLTMLETQVDTLIPLAMKRPGDLHATPSW